MIFLLRLLLGLAALVALPASGLAAASSWAPTDQGGVRLISAADSVGRDGALRLGLQFRMDPGWKIYWRNPGFAGFPPRIDWTGSDNATGWSMLWPAPHRFSVQGVDSLGYEGQVVLPILARVPDPSRPVHLVARVSYLTCSDICVPHDATLTLDLGPGSGAAGPEAQLIDRYRQQVPRTPRQAGFQVDQVVTAGTGKQAVLQLRLTSVWPLRAPDLFVEGPDGTLFLAPKARLSDGGRKADLDVAVQGLKAGDTLAGVPLTLTIEDGARAAQIAVTPRQGALSPVGGAAAAGRGLWAILGLAFLGGLILNLMPCVLPVLSLKVLSVISHGGRAASEVRLPFLASGLGVLAAFWALAAAAVGLKLAGVAVGWGMQFQQPVFVTFLALLVTLFACNLWGWFEVPLPAWLAGSSAAHGAGRPHSVAGHFGAGVFATLLATPCSAPFLGTAVGFALARGPWEIALVFTALGLGMAFPYLGIALMPRMATWLPRPGRWMVTVRRLLGFALAGTALWLLVVLSAEVGRVWALALGGVLAAIVLLLGLAPRLPESRRRLSAPVVVALALGAFLLPGLHQVSGPGMGEGVDDPVRWAPFAPGTVAAGVRDGHVVLVDVTAEWCITCQVNKRLVLYRGAPLAALGGGKVVALRADWTNPSPAITAYLASFGRYGVPMDVVYGPKAPSGILLPEILNESVVMDAIRRAGG